MNTVTLRELEPRDRPVWDALAHLYAYDFSAFFDIKLGDDGTFPKHECFDNVWTDSDRYGYLIYAGTEIAGFGIVRWFENAFEIEQFLVLRKFRRQGVGRNAAMKLFDRHQGHWIVDQVKENQPAIKFWHFVVAQYTDGNFETLTQPYPHQTFKS